MDGYVMPRNSVDKTINLKDKVVMLGSMSLN